jgi:hypothetical protein
LVHQSWCDKQCDKTYWVPVVGEAGFPLPTPKLETVKSEAVNKQREPSKALNFFSMSCFASSSDASVNDELVILAEFVACRDPANTEEEPPTFNLCGERRVDPGVSCTPGEPDDVCHPLVQKQRSSSNRLQRHAWEHPLAQGLGGQIRERDPYDMDTLQRADSTGTHNTQTQAVVVTVEMQKVFENADYVTFKKVTRVRHSKESPELIDNSFSFDKSLNNTIVRQGRSSPVLNEFKRFQSPTNRPDPEAPLQRKQSSVNKKVEKKRQVLVVSKGQRE